MDINILGEFIKNFGVNTALIAGVAFVFNKVINHFIDTNMKFVQAVQGLEKSVGEMTKSLNFFAEKSYQEHEKILNLVEKEKITRREIDILYNEIKKQ
jgi:hypothetical protein